MIRLIGNTMLAEILSAPAAGTQGGRKELVAGPRVIGDMLVERNLLLKRVLLIVPRVSHGRLS